MLVLQEYFDFVIKLRAMWRGMCKKNCGVIMFVIVNTEACFENYSCCF